MGIDDTLRMRYRAYKDETCQFLATLEVIRKWYKERAEEEFSSKVTTGRDTLSPSGFSALAEMYGFEAEGQPELGN
ncbi:unnamed protein product [Cochlearia groenlandica]